MFFKNMTDYVFSVASHSKNVGPRFAGKIKSRADQGPDQDQNLPLRGQGLAPGAKGAWGEATHTPIATVASLLASRVRCAPSSPVPARPDETSGCAGCGFRAGP